MATLAQSIESLKLVSSCVEQLEEAVSSDSPEDYNEAIKTLIPQFDASVSDFKGAIDRRISLMESIPHFIKMAEEQVSYFQKRIKASNFVLNYLKSSTKELMEANPDLDFSGTHKKLALQNAGGAQAISYKVQLSSISNVVDPNDLQSFPSEYLKELKVFVLDKQAFDADIRSGKIESKAAELLPRSKFVRIK
jgi:hypothetical protein